MRKILGLDYGEKRLGFAVSDPGGEFALPMATVMVRDEAHALDETVRICRESKADSIVVGLPLNMNGTTGPMALKVQAFVARLRAAAGIPVETYDERMTTSMVERHLIAVDMSRAKRKLVRDKMAAQAILQGYLDAQVPKYCCDPPEEPEASGS